MRKYRPEIDGLRAIAVFSVLIFHAEFAIFGHSLLPGGYNGVDVFFVISGYLITRIIFTDKKQTGTLLLLRFYERRARRILPMLLIVVCASFAAAWVLLLPIQYVEFSESAIASQVFLSNVYFYYATGVYGAESSLLKPLLHTWSLSIEEQFYLVYPILLLFLGNFSWRILLTCFFALLFASLGFAIFKHLQYPDFNFFLSFSRFWELLIGAVVAIIELRKGPARDGLLGKLASILGLGMILFSVTQFDLTSPPPNWETLVPTIGTALVIMFCSPKYLIARVIAARPLVGLGLISYSMYLWHFPIFAFARVENSTLSVEMKLALLFLTLVLSIGSYFVVEKPCRNQNSVSSRKFLMGILAGTVLLGAMSAFTIYMKGWQNRFEEISGFLNVHRGKQLATEISELSTKKRKIGFDEDKIKISIVGNSHGRDMFNILFQNTSTLLDVDFLYLPAELSCFDQANADNRSKADHFWQNKYYRQTDIVIVATKYNNGRCFASDKRRQKSNDLDGLPDFIRHVKNDSKLIIVFGNIAEFESINGIGIVDYYVREAERTGALDRITKDLKSYKAFARTMNRAYYERLRQSMVEISARVREIAEAEGGIYIGRTATLCSDTEAECTALTPGGHKIYSDGAHLTMEGAAYMGSIMLQSGLADVISRIAAKINTD